MVDSAAADPKVLVVTAQQDSGHGDVAGGVTGLVDQDVDCAYFDDIEFIIDKNIQLIWHGRNLATYDKVILYGGVGRNFRITHPLAAALLSLNIPSMTSGAERYIGVDKLTQYVTFSTIGVPIPKTYFANSDLLIKNAASIIGFPMIVKDILSSHGRNNHLINTQSELEELGSALSEDRYVAQTYIENDGDYRVLINSSYETFVFLRSRSVHKTHLNNTAAGASATEVLSPYPNMIECAKKIISHYGVPLLGIDMIVSDGAVYVLESNSQPLIFDGPLTKQKQAWFKNLIDH